MKTEAFKLSVFQIFLPNVLNIDAYNFELYRFKFGAFFSGNTVYTHSHLRPLNWQL